MPSDINYRIKHAFDLPIFGFFLGFLNFFVLIGLPRSIDSLSSSIVHFFFVKTFKLSIFVSLNSDWIDQTVWGWKLVFESTGISVGNGVETFKTRPATSSNSNFPYFSVASYFLFGIFALFTIGPRKGRKLNRHNWLLGRYLYNTLETLLNTFKSTLWFVKTHSFWFPISLSN